MSRAELTILLASPRGFCAGVERAIEIVEKALEQNGPPVYVRHEIVHNRHVVDGLRAKGAVFVEELDEVPDDALVVFSAHGVPKAIPAEARRRNLLYADATCPLVSKVHRGVEQHYRRGRTVLLIGHSGHPEVVGTMGQLPKGAVILVETVTQAETLRVPDESQLAYATQTTLSLRETETILAVLKRRFPVDLRAAARGHLLCHHQPAAGGRGDRAEGGPDLDHRLAQLFQLGPPGRGREGRRLSGRSLVQNAASMDWPLLQGVTTVAISAGASAPEALVDELIEACRARFADRRAGGRVVQEDVAFKTPPIPVRQAS